MLTGMPSSRLIVVDVSVIVVVVVVDDDDDALKIGNMMDSSLVRRDYQGCENSAGLWQVVYYLCWIPSKRRNSVLCTRLTSSQHVHGIWIEVHRSEKRGV